VDSAEIPSLPSSSTDVYAFFFSEISQLTSKNLMNGLATATREPGVTGVHLLFQSAGGFVGDGVALYNFFKHFPLELSLYNTGTVGSSAVIAYLGAKRRVVSRTATFMIHRSTAPPTTIPTAEKLKAAVSALRIDDERTEAILRERLKIPKRKWSDLRHKEFWFTAKDAIANGLATEIGDFVPPRGVRIYTFC
jgi:ATP-dependent Clp protease protease subunit